ncbi:MAG: TIGR03545 family protein [Spirochaetaceae bacterium]|jgi:uncharacterized protein (TIGR03545 family)|nr:TIGR03545 family protein [Spirochaetaceae bacterium]
MAKKVPALFRKPIPKEKFEKKYIKYIEQKADKEFLYSVFELQDSVYVLCADIEDKQKQKKLSLLAKAIKQNRKLPVKIIPLAALCLIVAALVVFFTVFLNPLLENAMERGLENVFEARVEINGFNANLLKFNISINSISIANRDKPMTNLFQMDKTVIRLLPNAVLRGKIYIEEIRADAIRFGTPRTISGALPEYELKRLAEAKKQKEKDAGPPLIDFQNFDAAALLDREYEKLQSVKVYNDILAFYDSSVETWKHRVDDVKIQADTLKNSAQTIMNFNINSIDVKNPADIKKITDLIRDGKIAMDNVQKAADTATELVNGVQADVKTAQTLQKNARNAITEDTNRFKSYFDFSGGGYHEILDPIIKDILSDQAEVYIAYGERALEVLEKVKASSQSIAEKTKDEKPKVEKYKGRDVLYPSRQYPKFYLGILASDWTAGNTHWAFDLRDVSSNPDLTAKPVSLKVNFNETVGEKRYVNFNGRADLRSSVNELFNTEIAGGNLAVNFENKFEQLGIGGFTGVADLKISASGGRDGSIGAGIDSHVAHAAINEAQGTIATAIASAVSQVPAIDLGLVYRKEGNGGDSKFNINTNIGDIILASLKKMAAEYAKQGIALLEKQLRERLTPLINESIVSQENLNDIFALAKGDQSALTSLKNSLQVKINEMEKKANDKLDEAKEQAKDAAKDKTKDLLKNSGLNLKF